MNTYIHPLQIAQALERGYHTAPFLQGMSAATLAWLKGGVRQVYCAPPRHGKSVLLCRYAVACFLLYFPKAQVIIAANSARTAQQHMYAVANILSTLALQGEIVPAPTSVNQYRAQLQGGGLIHAIGIRSTALGLGGDLIVLDDPYRHILDAYSARVREQVESWFFGTLMSRLHPNGSIAVVQQRMHPDDIAGKLIALGWESFTHPAIGQDGNALFPQRYPIQALQEIREQIGERFFAALYQQAPLPDSGTLFITDYFAHRYTALPTDLYRVLSVDTAVSVKDSADYTALALWGWNGQQAYLIDMYRARLSYPELKRLLLSYHSKADLVVVEDANIGSALRQDLARAGLRVVAYQPRLKKELRALKVIALFENGRVWLPQSHPHLHAWLQEHLQFPAGEHDDFVDTTVMALETLITDTARPNRWRVLVP